MADRAERQGEIERQLVEEGRKRIDELQASFADERRHIDGLYTDLADARTAAMIAVARRRRYAASSICRSRTAMPRRL